MVDSNLLLEMNGDLGNKPFRRRYINENSISGRSLSFVFNFNSLNLIIDIHNDLELIDIMKTES